MNDEKRWVFYDDGDEAIEDGIVRRNLNYYVADTEKECRAAFWIRGDAERYCRDRNRQEGIPAETGDAHGEVDAEMRSRLDELHNLLRLANPGVDLDEWSNDELLAMDIGYGVPGALSREYIQEAAEERLDAYPLAVERTVSLEVVLGTGGPDTRLIFECDLAIEEPGPYDPQGARDVLDIRRVLFRYSWTGSAEVELRGEDREIAEEFGRRVVPELVE